MSHSWLGTTDCLAVRSLRVDLSGAPHHNSRPFAQHPWPNWIRHQPTKLGIAGSNPAGCTILEIESVIALAPCLGSPHLGTEATGSTPRLNILDESPTEDDRKFHGWRLLGFLAVVVVAIAVVSMIVDWVVLGSLFDRVL